MLITKNLSRNVVRRRLVNASSFVCFTKLPDCDIIRMMTTNYIMEKKNDTTN
jgi:hypothetical protein